MNDIDVIAAELSNVFGEDDQARALLEAIGYPRHLVPRSENATEFWRHVWWTLSSGIVEKGPHRLLAAAKHRYPRNRVFSEMAGEEVRSPVRSRPLSVMTVRGYSGLYATLDRIRSVLSREGIECVPLPVAAKGEAISVELELPLETAVILAHLIRLDALQSGSEIEVTALSGPGHFLRRIMVEGPDQALFEVTHLPASTRVAEIARGIVGEYDPKVWGDSRGQLRSAVIDYVTPDGRSCRLMPDSTLIESGIGEDATLHVAPESTAGSGPPPGWSTLDLPDQAQIFTRQGISRTLAVIFGNGTQARTLLAQIGYPEDQIADAVNAAGFWNAALAQLGHGIVDNGFRELVRNASRMYPGNALFRQMSDTADPPLPVSPVREELRDGRERNGSPHGSSITVQGHQDPFTILDTARRVAAEMQLNGEVNLGISSAGWILLDLPGMRPEQAAQLATRLEADLRNRNIQIQASAAAAQFRDYLIRRLYVEGPDQARFELTDVAASTRVAEVARGVASEYDPKIWSDAKGQPRTAVVDHVRADGSSVRLQPGGTLHDSGVGEDSTLHVAPESTAGIDPEEREAAMVRARLQVQSYMTDHPAFEVDTDNDHAPHEYVFRFSANSWAPPAAPGEPPEPVDDHVVFLVLPADFPIKAPQAFWQTPVFHPNIDPKTGYVCLGDLGDDYRPGLDFHDLCQLLVDLASYQNYSIEGVFNGEARQWAVSLPGQEAIEARGGLSLIRRTLTGRLQPRPLEIKRIK